MGEKATEKKTAGKKVQMVDFEAKAFIVSLTCST